MQNKVIENYVLHNEIGSGQFGKVYRSTNFVKNSEFAIKVMKLNKINEIPKLLEFTMNEIQILSNIQNQNIIQFIEMLRTSNNLYLVYEYCNGGTLEELLKKRKFLPEEEALVFFKQILCAFQSLIKDNILHRDLKPSNIWFHNGVLKIADFGFCKTLNNKNLAESMVGSPIYMAPEILKGEKYDIKADIWSMGVVLFEMLFGFCPYEDRTIPLLLNQIDSKELTLPTDKQTISQNLTNLLKKMLVVNSKNRIDWNTLLNWFNTGEHINYQNINQVSSVNPTIDQSFIQYNSKIISKIKNKIVFMTRILKQVNQQDIGQIGKQSAYQLIKKINKMSYDLQNLLTRLDDPTVVSQFKNLDKYKQTKEFLQILQISEYEYKAIDKLYNQFKNTFNNLILLEDGNDNFQTVLLQLLVVVNKKINDNTDNDEYQKKWLLFGNNILDCLMNDEFFITFIDENIKFNDQIYFENVRKYSTDNLRSLFEHKFKYAQSNYQTTVICK